MAKKEYKLGSRFHVTVGKGKYDAILFFEKKGYGALFTLPLSNILWDKPIAEFNLPPIHNIENGEKGAYEDDIKSYVSSARFGGLHPEKEAAVILEKF